MNDSYSKPLITTIIPTYRRPKLLRRAIKSVLNQTYPYFQVCVYDNASGDETAEVVAELAKKDSRLKYYCHQENIGMAKNFNFGLAKVNTPFFSFLSDDDILLPNFYEVALKGFDKYPEAMFSATQTIIVNPQGQIVGYNKFFSQNLGLYLPYKGFLTMLKNYLITWTGILFRREVIEKVGLLDEEVVVGSDADFEYRIAAHFPFFISSETGAVHQINPEGAFSLIKIQEFWSGYLKIIKNLTENKKIPSTIRLEIRGILTQELKKNIFYLTLRYILRKDYEESLSGVKILCNHYHSPGRVFLLKSIIKMCQYFPFTHQLFFYLNKFRKFLIQKKLKPLEKKYRNISSFLEIQ